MKIRKDVMELSIPIIAEQTFIMIMGVVNTIMAGHLGKEAVSAIGMVDGINNLFISFFSALSVGVTVVVAQYAGKRNYQKANDSALHGLVSSVVISSLITILIYISRTSLVRLLYGTAEQSVLNNAYMYLYITLLTYPLIAATSIASGVLRGVGDTKTPMKISIFMNVLNIIFSFVLIYGIEIHSSVFSFIIPGLGVKGAAIGIAIARTIGATLMLLTLISGTKAIRLSISKDTRVDINILKSIFGIGVPASVESVIFSLGKLLTQVFVVGFGTATIAAHYVANSVFGLLNIPGTALSITATTMVGQSMGRGDTDQANDNIYYLRNLTTVITTIICALAFPLAGKLAALYTSDKEVIGIAAVLIRTVAVAMPVFWSSGFIIPAGLKGAGDAKYTMVSSIISMWAFRIVVGYVLSVRLGMSALGVWLGMYSDWLVRGTLYYVRLRKGKWKLNVVLKG